MKAVGLSSTYARSVLGPLAMSIAACCALVACGEASLTPTTATPPDASSADAVGSDAVGAHASAAERSVVTIGEFEGHFNVTTGEVSIHMVGDTDVDAEYDAAARTTELRTTQQALWCGVQVGRTNQHVRLATVIGSIGASLDACGIPDNYATGGQGALCATVQVTAPRDTALVRPVAEIIEITSGYEPWTFMETEGVIGVAPEELTGPNAPDPFSVFGYPSLEANASARATWAFRDPGGIVDVAFRGRIVVQLQELCNEVDDDCDGEVDEGAQCGILGASCGDHIDCASGQCDGGLCTNSSCGDGELNGTETDVDCGGLCAPCADTQACVENGDCASDVCFRDTCVPLAYPTVGQVVISEVHADSGPASEADLEWFEVVNTSADTLRLGGCEFSSSAWVFDASPGLNLAPGDFHVFAARREPGDAAHDQLWSDHFDALGARRFMYAGGTGLFDTAGDIRLRCPTETSSIEIDRIDYTDAALSPRVSAQVDPAHMTVAGNDAAANLCASNASYFAGYFGTPGASNTSCDTPVTACEMSGTRSATVPQGSDARFTTMVHVPGVTDVTAATDSAGNRFQVEVGYGPSGSDPFDDVAGAWTWAVAEPDAGWNDTTAPGYDQYQQQVLASGAEGSSVAVAFRATGDDGATYVGCDGRGALGVIAAVGQVEAVGDVIITEFLPNPSSPGDLTGEWFELHNMTDRAIDLDGCEVRDDGTDAFVIDGAAVIEAGGFGVFARGSDRSFGPDGPVVFDYPVSWSLDNYVDEIEIACAIGGTQTVVDRLTYTSTPTAYAIQVDPLGFGAVANDSLDVRCYANRTDAYVVSSGEHYGTPGVANPPCYPIDFCRAHAPDDLLHVTAGSAKPVYARLGVTGRSEGWNRATSPLLLGQVGLGPDSSNPSVDPTGWTWTDAGIDSAYHPFSLGIEQDYDGWVGSVNVPLAGGPYDVAYRFSGDAGATWTYCDRNAGPASDGSLDGYSPLNALELSVAEEIPIADCTMVAGSDVTGEFPQAMVRAAARVIIPGVSDGPGVNLHPSVRVEHAYGTAGTDPDAWSNWQLASGDLACTDCEVADEYFAEFEVPHVRFGPYDHAFRVTGDAGGTWTYCDTNGGAYDAADAAALVPKPWDVGYCALSPTTGEGQAGWSSNIEVRYYATDLTARTTGVDEHSDLVVDFGLRDAGESAYYWGSTYDSTPVRGVADDDVQRYRYNNPPAGSYELLARVSGDGGFTWTYCGVDTFGPNSNSVQPTRLTTFNRENMPYSESFSGLEGRGAYGPGNREDPFAEDWTVDVSGANLTSAADFFKVVEIGWTAWSYDEVMYARGISGTAIWQSPRITTNGNTVRIEADTDTPGSSTAYESNDCIAVYVRMDGGGWSRRWRACGYSASIRSPSFTRTPSEWLEIRVVVTAGGQAERFWFDDVEVEYD